MEIRLAPLRGLALLLLALASAGCSWQSGIVYQPSRELVRTPADAGMRYEDVVLQAADGVELHGWFVPAPARSRGAVLFCHGNAGNISHRLESIAVFRALGLDVLIFDYRGYGRSGGEPAEEGTYLDARAAWDHLVGKRGVPPERVVVFGRSLGGAIAAHLAAERTPRALILESAFSSVPDLASDLSWLPLRWIACFDYETAESVKAVKCPVLVVHSREDEVVPFAHGERIFSAAPAPKSFLEIRGSHNAGWRQSLRTYFDGLRRFLDRQLGPQVPRP